MIYCAWLIWNDEKMIWHSINSVKDQVDHFIFIDGAFLSNLYAVSTGEYKSTDITRKMVDLALQDHKVTWIEPTDFWRDEAAKRTAYCEVFEDLAEEGDWLLWLDSDEVLTDNVVGGFQYLKKRADYVPHWVWVKSTYPAESPHQPFGKTWEGYRNYIYPDDTYFDLGKRINLLPYIEDLHYESALQPYNVLGEPVVPPLDAYTMKYFMIWNLVWMRDRKALQYRLERSIIERGIDRPWAKKILQEMEEKYSV